MASTSDIRDIMNVGAATDARPAKKQKLSAQQRKDQYAGMSKEVRGLMMGDGVPPVQVQENRYKTKPKLAKRTAPWVRESFINSARTDGLVLTHWKRGGHTVRPDTPGGTGAPVTPADSKTENDADTKAIPIVQSDYYFAKYNTKPSPPSYTDEEYAQHLTNEDWTKEETDYLIRLVQDYDLRWVVIWDRYDWQPQLTNGEGDDAMAAIVTPKSRRMEDLKARYYEVARKVMTIHHPLSSMSTAEFDLHEKMKNFDPVREHTRKTLAEMLLARSPDELREEEVLLGELKRIVDHEDRFMEERRELYQRLDHPVSNGSIEPYTSSQGLMQLVQNLLASDKNKKRRSIAPGAEGNTPAQGHQPVPQSATSARGDHRSSLSGPGAAGGGNNKKGAGSQGVQPRQLSQRDEIRFGVAHHERLTSGVQFRQARIEKLVLAKSAAQQQKLQDALGQLGVGVRAKMPTSRVCAEYESLVQGINVLLDVRKVAEKVGNETRVLEAQKEMRERKERGEDDEVEDKKETDPQQIKTAEEDPDTQEQEKVESDNEEQDETQDKDGDDEENEDSENENEDEDEDKEEADEDEDEEAQNADIEAQLDEDDNEDAEPEVEDSDQDEDEDMPSPAEEEPEEPEAAEDSKPPVSHKRSASIMSLGSEKSSKKARK